MSRPPDRARREQRVRSLLSLDDTLAGGTPTLQPNRVLQQRLPLEHRAAESSRRDDLPTLAGFDEAGRGALAGPVVVGCVSYAWSWLRPGDAGWRDGLLDDYVALNDSKRVSERVRERLYQQITGDTRWAVGCASAQEIDVVGIVEACRRAARRAYHRLGVRADLLLFDRGLRLGPPEEGPSVELTKGDARSFHIAAASILAKVGRDAIMRTVSSRYPIYAFEQHKGYGTAAHRTAIQAQGPCPLHRRSFLRSIL